MARVVVVSTVTVGSTTLAPHVDESDELVVVVPAVEQSRLDWLANDDADAQRRARKVGDTVADRAPPPAAEVAVSLDVPRQAVLDAIAEHEPDRLIVVLRDGEDATWLEEGQIGEIPGYVAGVPITRVRLASDDAR